MMLALFAPWIAPHRPDQRFGELAFAPPSGIHLFGADMRWPHVHPRRAVSLLERRFEEDQSRAVPLRFFAGGLVSTEAASGAPLLLLGADGIGRDRFSRLLYASRITLALAMLSTAGAIVIGALVGAFAGYTGGWVDDLLGGASEFFLVLPAVYVALAVRAALPDVIPASQVFLLLTAIFSFLGWPLVARGVRGIVASERQQEYVVAARALGAGTTRVVSRHLLPATLGHLGVQATLLFPAFILAESTMSAVGFGFPDVSPTWGTMLTEPLQSILSIDAWALAPAAAIFVVTLAFNLLVQGAGRPPVQLGR
jgi:peptide/nickel transport system permease protein